MHHNVSVNSGPILRNFNSAHFRTVVIEWRHPVIALMRGPDTLPWKILKSKISQMLLPLFWRETFKAQFEKYASIPWDEPCFSCTLKIGPAIIYFWIFKPWRLQTFANCCWITQSWPPRLSGLPRLLSIQAMYYRVPWLPRLPGLPKLLSIQAMYYRLPWLPRLPGLPWLLSIQAL